MLTFRSAFLEYFRIKRPEFCKNNPNIAEIFSAAAVALTSKMWVEGTDEVPGVFYIALIGEPRTGKTSFLRHYFRLFRGTGISQIPIGSPEAMLQAIDDIRHGYIWYDEVAHLAKLIDSYMGTLPTILNKAYYLDELSQIRTDKKRSVVVNAGSYFIHVYFAGTERDWVSIERKAPGGFVRRTLTIFVDGIIPFFKKSHLSLSDEAKRYALEKALNRILEILKNMTITVRLPEFPSLAERLMREYIDNEKKSMIEDYLYKVFAGLLVGHLITFDLDEDPDAWNVNEIIERMQRNGERYGVKVEYDNPSLPPVMVNIDARSLAVNAEAKNPGAKITDYLPPNFANYIYNILLDSTRRKVSAPDDVILRNVEKINAWLEAGGSVVVSQRKFVREVLVLGNADQYKAVMTLLEDGGYIRTIDGVYRGRNVKYVILDPKARICGNCQYYRSLDECPRLKGVFDFKEAASKVPPWEGACKRFVPVDEVDGGDV